MAQIFHAWDASRLDDGHPHHRGWSGECANCGASPREPHYLLRKKEGEMMDPMTDPRWHEQTVTIKVAIRVADEADAELWSVADNVDISMRNACDEVAKALETDGVQVVVS